jgi:c-di-GMP-binding flagellar brake protein YcgR
MLKNFRRFLARFKRRSNDDAEGFPGQEPEGPVVTNPQHIHWLLNFLYQDNIWLTVRPGGGESHDSFISSILALDIEKKQLVFDELNPFQGNQQLMECHQFAVGGKIRGAKASFLITEFSAFERNGTTYYRAEYPKTIRYLQRRKGQRVPISSTMLVSFEARMFESPYFVRGSVVNVSSGGLAINIFSTHGFSVGDKLKDCKLMLPGGHSIYFSFEIRTVKPVHSAQRLMIGGQFIKIAPDDLDKIRRLMSSVDRDRLQHM